MQENVGRLKCFLPRVYVVLIKEENVFFFFNYSDMYSIPYQTHCARFLNIHVLERCFFYILLRVCICNISKRNFKGFV